MAIRPRKTPGAFALVALGIAAVGTTPCLAASQLVYSNDFDGGEAFAGGVAGGFSGAGAAESVQGWAGLGTGADQFAGNFLRNEADNSGSDPAPASTLALTGLPGHTSLDLDFLLGMIDSWDGSAVGTGFPDFFNISLDSTPIFSETFDRDPADQSYIPPAGVLLARDSLGFSASFQDAAYDMGLDPQFDAIAHTGSTLTINFFASGEGWFGLFDESWALENVRVTLNDVPEPSGILLLALVLTAVSGRRTRS